MLPAGEEAAAAAEDGDEMEPPRSSSSSPCHLLHHNEPRHSLEKHARAHAASTTRGGRRQPEELLGDSTALQTLQLGHAERTRPQERGARREASVRLVDLVVLVVGVVQLD